MWGLHAPLQHLSHQQWKPSQIASEFSWDPVFFWLFQNLRVLYHNSIITYQTSTFFNIKDHGKLNGCFKSSFSVSKYEGKNSAFMVVSWSCLFSKHTEILTPLSQGHPAAQSSFCTDLPPVTVTISCSLCFTFPWPKGATEELDSCSSLCYLTITIFLMNQLTWSHIHWLL